MSTHDDILDAAATIYADDGAAGLSMRRVAAEIGVSATAIYRHFENKEQLVVEVCARASRLFETYLLQALREPDPPSRMRTLGRQYREFGLDRAEYYRALFMSPHPEFENLREETTQQFGVTFQLLVDRVRENQDSGHIAEADPIATAATIWAHVHGLVSLFLDGHMPDMSREEFSNFFDQSVAILMRGLSP